MSSTIKCQRRATTGLGASVFARSVLLAAGLTGLVDGKSDAAAPTATLPYGDLRGAWDMSVSTKTVAAFRDIPFGSSGRFEVPQPVNHNL